MGTKEHRKAIPLGVKLHACLLLLGFTDEEIAGGAIAWDHFPALGLRPIDKATGQMVPAPNDPHYLRPMRVAEHKIKTSGGKATTAGSDIHAIAKAKRLAGERPPKRKQKIPARKNAWPKRKLGKR